jgi:3-oxoadipate CoA-transferase alpha subunit
MAMAGNITVIQAANVVAPGEIDPETIITPGIFVNRVVEIPEPAIESTLVAAGETYP